MLFEAASIGFWGNLLQKFSTYKWIPAIWSGTLRMLPVRFIQKYKFPFMSKDHYQDRSDRCKLQERACF